MVFDFFCGCGGASAGFREAGMEIAFGLDNDPDAGRTFKANFPEAEFFDDDIATMPDSAIDIVVDAWPNHALLFNACAPCQPFSRQRCGTLRPDDERLGLLTHVLRFVRRYRPEYVFVENVPGLQDAGAGGGIFQGLLHTLQELGYSTDHRVVKSQDYGVPQRRMRLVLLASLLGPITFPEPTYGVGTLNPEYSTVRKWIKSLPAISAGEAHPRVPNHRAARLSSLNLQRIGATPQGGGWRDLPPKLLPKSRKAGFNGYTDVYGRLRWDAPAPALTTRCISYSNGRFGHPEQDRAISVREAACLQTLPNDFVLTGSLNSQARQVGNAVPTLLAQRFGACIAEHFAGNACGTQFSFP
ncbi:MAG: DNA cytosine methyltransferase [Caldilineaceae bacterium]|nr:DNA cytosine methyltransferase [Caldilineaceae bacterium]